MAHTYHSLLNEQHLAAIVTSADDAIISKTLDGIIRSCNPAAERMFGYQPAEIIGQSVLRLIPPDRQNEEEEILKRLRAGLRIEHYETMRQTKDGSLLEVSLTISPMRDATGRIIGASKIIRDITERKHIENRLTESEKCLREAAEGLEQQVAIRTAELSQSHQQLRALTAQINLTEQKERQRLAGELHDYLGQILALGRIKLGLAKKQSMDAPLAGLLDEVQASINKAITYTRSLVSQLSPPVLKEFGLAMALSWLAEQMSERDLMVRLEFRTQIPPLMEDKALLLFQSIRELLLNCIKHAHVAEAMLVVDQHDRQLHITISDSGTGFDPSDISHLMQTTGANPRYGLFSIRERMLSLGGYLELQSAIGKGTVAALVFPLTTSAAELSVSPETVNSRKDESKTAKDVTMPTPTADALRLLIVDDHAMVREGLCSLLSVYEDIHIVGEARNGKEALELASRLKPDGILMDVTMPDIDGIEVTRRIKTDSPHILIVGMSVHSAEQVERAMKEAGAAAFINKEAAVEDLHQTILAAWNSRVKVE